MTEKTYGAYGLIEYEMTLQIGGRQVRANFSGGSISQYGIVPATYTTANPIVQLAIEQSRSYRSGRIQLVSSVEKDGIAPGGVERRSAEGGGVALDADAPSTVAPSGEAAAERRGCTADTVGGDGDALLAEPGGARGADAGEAEARKEVRVACMEDAIEHLRTLGYKPSKLTNAKAVEAAAQKEGIEFVYE